MAEPSDRVLRSGTEEAKLTAARDVTNPLGEPVSPKEERPPSPPRSEGGLDPDFPKSPSTAPQASGFKESSALASPSPLGGVQRHSVSPSGGEVSPGEGQMEEGPSLPLAETAVESTPSTLRSVWVAPATQAAQVVSSPPTPALAPTEATSDLAALQGPGVDRNLGPTSEPRSLFSKSRSYLSSMVAAATSRNVSSPAREGLSRVVGSEGESSTPTVASGKDQARSEIGVGPCKADVKGEREPYVAPTMGYPDMVLCAF
jgi:hypothetical protein